ncbi:unnamed protein product [Choristocarpus tenellus]
MLTLFPRSLVHADGLNAPLNKVPRGIAIDSLLLNMALRCYYPVRSAERLLWLFVILGIQSCESGVRGQTVASDCSGKDTCSVCTQAIGCTWCDSSCVVSTVCNNVADDKRECPATATTKFLINLAWLVGAAIGLGLLVNCINRYLGKRHEKKLQRSIFTLPCYVYKGPSSTFPGGVGVGEKMGTCLANTTEHDGCRGSEIEIHIDKPRGTPVGDGGPEETFAEGKSNEESRDAEVSLGDMCAICLAHYEESELVKRNPIFELKSHNQTLLSLSY